MRVQLRILLRRQLAAGEHHDRHVGQRRVVADLLQHVEARHVRQAQVEHDAIARPARAASASASAPVPAVTMSMSSWPSSSVMLSCSAGLSSTTSRRLRRGCGVFLDRVERRLQPFGRRRLGHEGEGAARQAVLAVLVERDDLHRDVPRRRVLLELAQHRPAEHVGQEHVERDGRRPVLARQRQRVGAAHRDEHLEALVVREVDQHARVMRIVLDDQQHGVARLRRRADRPARCSTGALGQPRRRSCWRCEPRLGTGDVGRVAVAEADDSVSGR